MNHLDFVIWIIGWAFVMGFQDKGTVWRGIRNILLAIIWIAIAILIY